MSSKRTPVDVVRNRIKSNYLPSQYQRWYIYLCEAFGVESQRIQDFQRKCGRDDYGDGLLWFPDISDTWIKSGSADMIKAATMIAMSRLLGKDPEPEYVGVSRMTAEVRKAFFLDNYHGYEDSTEGFGTDAKDAFVDMDTLGSGVVEFGHVDDVFSKERRSDGKYNSRLQWMTDRFVRSPIQSSWYASWEYLEYGIVKAAYGEKAVQHARMVLESGDGYKPKIDPEYVRVLTYYDIGYAGGKPTKMTFIGSIETSPIIEDNIFNRIPCAFGVGFTAPHKRYADGRIRNQLSTQDAMRAIFDHIKDTLGYPSIDLVDDEVFEADEWENVINGARRAKVKFNDLNDKKPWERIPGMEIAQTALTWYEMVNKQYNMDSGLAEFDRANTVSKGRSASEMMIMDSRLKMNQALSVSHTMLFLRRLVIRSEQCALAGDYHPRTLSIRNTPMRINVKGEPNSWIGEWLDEPAKILISQESLTADEDHITRMARVENLMRLGQGLETGAIDSDWWWREFVEAMGFDSEQALRKQGAPGAMDAVMQMMAGGGVPQGGQPSQVASGAPLPNGQLANAG